MKRILKYFIVLCGLILIINVMGCAIETDKKVQPEYHVGNLEKGETISQLFELVKGQVMHMKMVHLK